MKLAVLALGKVGAGPKPRKSIICPLDTAKGDVLERAVPIV